MFDKWRDRIRDTPPHDDETVALGIHPRRFLRAAAFADFLLGMSLRLFLLRGTELAVERDTI